MIRKFASLEEAVAAGFTIILGNGEYAEGGEEISRERYPGLCAALGIEPDDKPFALLEWPRDAHQHLGVGQAEKRSGK